MWPHTTFTFTLRLCFPFSHSYPTHSPTTCCPHAAHTPQPMCCALCITYTHFCFPLFCLFIAYPTVPRRIFICVCVALWDWFIVCVCIVRFAILLWPSLTLRCFINTYTYYCITRIMALHTQPTGVPAIHFLPYLFGSFTLRIVLCAQATHCLRHGLLDYCTCSGLAYLPPADQPSLCVFTTAPPFMILYLTFFLAAGRGSDPMLVPSPLPPSVLVLLPYLYVYSPSSRLRTLTACVFGSWLYACTGWIQHFGPSPTFCCGYCCGCTFVD